MQKLINVKVHPRARLEKVEHSGDGSYEVWTTAAPDKGAANSAVTKLLAKELRVAPSRLKLKRGATSRNKAFELAE